MKRTALLIAFITFLALPALAEIEFQGQGQGQVARPNVGAAQQQVDEARRQMNQLRMRIGDYYVVKFKEEVGLNDDQFFKVSNFVRSYIDMRFNAFITLREINQQLQELQRRQNPSEVEEERLILQRARVNNNLGNMENQFLMKIQPDLKTGQAASVLTFNSKFFSEILPDLIEQARIQAQQGQQRQQPQRQNPNRGNPPPNGPNRNIGDALLPLNQK